MKNVILSLEGKHSQTLLFIIIFYKLIGKKNALL
jgi:hypothetical protein